MNFRYLASHQDSSTTRRRLQKGFPYVAADGEAIIGTITLYGPSADSPCEWYRRPGIYSFGQFAVDPAFQHGGVGTRLLKTVESRAREMAALELALDTAEGATHLCRWYGSRGFRFVQHVCWGDTNYRSVVLSKCLI